MRTDAVTPTMQGMGAGTSCGARHDGRRTFGVVDGDRVATCHAA